MYKSSNFQSRYELGTKLEKKKEKKISNDNCSFHKSSILTSIICQFVFKRIPANFNMRQIYDDKIENLGKLFIVGSMVEQTIHLNLVCKHRTPTPTDRIFPSQ